MQRRKFVRLAATSVCAAAGGYYLLSDKSSFVRSDIVSPNKDSITFKPDEKEILYLASLAPSGHNTQPWIVKYVAPYHWIIGNDKSKWLPAVDPTQRETILSVGAFLQNLEYAANHFGYACQCNILATTNQDEDVVEIRLVPSANTVRFDIDDIKLRRTVRANYLTDPLTKDDIFHLTDSEIDFLHFIPNTSTGYQLLNEQTIETNRIQSYRDAAQEELANWMRFSSKDAEKHCDGLTTASMEIEGLSGWFVRNYYGKADVMKKSFREQSIDKVKEQVSHSGGWLLMTSKDSSVSSLIESGKRLQRLLLKIRKRNIAIHPMTQLLEEAPMSMVHTLTGLTDTVQFVLRTGYIKTYPKPVSLRRPVDWFVRQQS